MSDPSDASVATEDAVTASVETSGESVDGKSALALIDVGERKESGGTPPTGEVETVDLNVVAKVHSTVGGPEWTLVVRASGTGRSIEVAASVDFNEGTTSATASSGGAAHQAGDGNDPLPSPVSSEPPVAKPIPGSTTPDSPDSELHSGDATCSPFTVGSCGFPDASDDLVGSMNASDYAEAEACGSCVRIYGPDGTVDVRIIDECVDCKPGGIDLSMSAFGKIAPLTAGRVPITWQSIADRVSGPVVYHFNDASNAYWTAVQIRNHRYAIASVEAKRNGAWVNLRRDETNYFVADAGLGDGPCSFRITDVRGHTLEDSGISPAAGSDAVGAAQFPFS